MGAAAQKGDLATLEGLFAEDVVSYADGGGIVRTAAQAPVALATIDASADGINQIMWIMRPSKLAARFT
jgi:hypothetical protein